MHLHHTNTCPLRWLPLNWCRYVPRNKKKCSDPAEKRWTVGCGSTTYIHRIDTFMSKLLPHNINLNIFFFLSETEWLPVCDCMRGKNCPATAARALCTYLLGGWCFFVPKILLSRLTDAHCAYKKHDLQPNFCIFLQKNTPEHLAQEKLETEKHYSTAGQFILINFANATRRLIEKKASDTSHKIEFSFTLSELWNRSTRVCSLSNL